MVTLLKNELTLVKTASFGNIACDVYKQGDDFFMTREQIGSALGYLDPIRAISKLHSRNEDRLNKLSRVDRLTTVDGKVREVILYSAKGVYEICRYSTKEKANEFYDFVYEMLEGLRKGELKIVQVQQPQSIEELIIMQARSVIELKAKVEQQSVELTTLNHRMDNVDSLDTIGDPRQRLGNMVKKYVYDNGLGYPKVWREFNQKFDTAYRTNIGRLKAEYAKSHNLPKISTPAYLEAVGRLEDGIRVADKMLNQLAAR